jgi:hypothetical protein
MYMPPFTCRVVPPSRRRLRGRRGRPPRRDLFRNAETAERNLARKLVALSLWQVLGHIGIDETGATQLTVMLRLPSSAPGRGSCRPRRPWPQHSWPGRVARAADHRGDVDDAADSGLHHAAHDQLGHAEDRLEIGVDHRIPLGVLHAHGEVVASDAGVVHQDAETAPKAFSISPRAASQASALVTSSASCPAP